MNRARILIVENDPTGREALASLLRSKGYEVGVASTSEEAMAELNRTLVHLAIIDVRLRDDRDPNDRSGLSVCANIDPLVSRIILTGYAHHDWRVVQNALQPSYGSRRLADGFFSKGDPREDILNSIEKILATEFEVLPGERIAVCTSGGDSPGMNAAIWAVVRAGLQRGLEVLGIQDGYQGLTEGRLFKLNWSDVGGLPPRGGTVLGTARHPDFRKREERQKAISVLLPKHVHGLVVIGGDGSMQGAAALAQDVAESGGELRTVAIPGTIDNDIAFTEVSLGADSAANAIINELRGMIKPAEAMRRIFVVEVMGRHCGYLAMEAAIGIGADAVMLPEELIAIEIPLPDGEDWREHVDRTLIATSVENWVEGVSERLRYSFSHGKRYGFLILAEGVRLLAGECAEPAAVASQLEQHIGMWPTANPPDVRVQTLGYPIRGVEPSRSDVRLGIAMGSAAVAAITDRRETDVMIGVSSTGSLHAVPFSQVVSMSSGPPHAYRQRLKDSFSLHEQATRSLPELALPSSRFP